MASDDTWANLVLDGLTKNASILTDPGLFAGAVLELAVSTSRSPTSGWAVVQLGLADGRVFVVERLLVQAGGERRLQVPLAAFASGQAQLAPADLVKQIQQVAVATAWGVGASVTVDDISLRW